MIKIVAELFIKPEAVLEFTALAKELVLESQKEPGCIAYDLHVNLNDSNQFTMLEVWKDMEAISQHNQSSHFNKVISLLPALSSKPAVINLYRQL